MPKPVKVSTRREDAAKTERVKKVEAVVQQTLNPAAVPDKVSEVEAAEIAVQKFTDEYARLEEMRDAFSHDFPDAYAALDEIKRQEDLVQDAIAQAHPLVQTAKQDVGPFTCQRKWKQAHYDDGEFTKLAIDLDPNVLHELLASGHIKKLALDKSVAGYFAQNPDSASVIQESWRKKVEMTPAVTAPKF